MKNQLKVSIVVAMDEARGIGKDERIPWHLRADLIRVKTLTKDQFVVLGRKTYDSMVWYYDKSGRKMPGKTYVIVTRDKDYVPKRENAVAVHSIDEAFRFIAGKSSEAFVIGGSNIFSQTIDFADTLYLTIVAGDFECDTFFPDYSLFTKLISEEAHESDGLHYRFLQLTK